MSDDHLRVHGLPHEISERDLQDCTVIVIDLLRATTTICQALASGARDVVPFREIDETLAAAAKAGRSRVVLGGERGGKRIEGFDLGNSPAEYTPEAVRGRRVFITTTNGTQALYHARLARRVVVGALVNLSVVVASVKDEPRIDILCAGTNGQETREDILAAGAIVHRLCQTPDAHDHQLNDAAVFADAEWSLLVTKAKLAGRTAEEELTVQLRDTLGGRNLIEVGLERDLAECAQIDRLNNVPEVDVNTWRISVPRD
jgi:2-phosphosulfolactate phosphatase